MTQPDFKFSVAEPSDSRSPLVRITGVLKEWKTDVKEYEGRNPSMGVKFDFIDVTVIESTEPYPFPVASFRLPYSDRSGSTWAVWAASLRDVVPMDVLQAADQPMDVLVGKSQEWYWAPCKLRLPGQSGAVDEKEWKLRDAHAWTVVSVEGFGSAGGAGNVLDAIIEFCEGPGKKDTEIYQWIYTNQSLKGMSGFASAIEGVSERVLLSSLVAAGKLKEEGDKYVSTEAGF